jgi:hypothetical protein
VTTGRFAYNADVGRVKVKIVDQMEVSSQYVEQGCGKGCLRDQGFAIVDAYRQ